MFRYGHPPVLPVSHQVGVTDFPLLTSASVISHGVKRKIGEVIGTSVIIPVRIIVDWRDGISTDVMRCILSFIVELRLISIIKGVCCFWNKTASHTHTYKRVRTERNWIA